MSRRKRQVNLSDEDDSGGEGEGGNGKMPAKLGGNLSEASSEEGSIGIFKHEKHSFKLGKAMEDDSDDEEEEIGVVEVVEEPGRRRRGR
jgi:hypothetical protein